MKVIYNDGEKERLKKAYDEMTDFRFFGDDNPDTIYSLSFKVTKPEIAQYVLLGLLHNRLEDFDLGIDVNTIHFNRVQDASDIRAQLHQFIDEIVV